MRTTSFLIGVIFVGTVAALAIAEPYEPYPSAAPGKVASTDLADICSVKGGLTYSKRHRATPEELKRSIRKRDHSTGGGEVDHRVPLCLGGADEEANLWWQRDFHEKDALEAYACRAVCNHLVPLEVAQGWFLAPDWRPAYRHAFNKEP